MFIQNKRKINFLRFLQGSSLGFSLVELLVSISVMAITAGIALSGGGKSLIRINLADNAASVEHLIREAQLKGSAINSVNGVFGGAGVHFSTVTSTSAIFFKDRVDPTILTNIAGIGVGDGIYSTAPINELSQTHQITGGNRISKLCTKNAPGPFVCGATNLTVSFTRPSQSAHIYINNSAATNYLVGCIQMDSREAPAAGYLRSIVVYQSGLIVRKSKQCNEL